MPAGKPGQSLVLLINNRSAACVVDAVPHVTALDSEGYPLPTSQMDGDADPPRPLALRHGDAATLTVDRWLAGYQNSSTVAGLRVNIGGQLHPDITSLDSVCVNPEPNSPTAMPVTIAVGDVKQGSVTSASGQYEITAESDSGTVTRYLAGTAP